MDYKYTIYKLYFDGDERVYIGKTKFALIKRRNAHIQMIKRGLHTNKRLVEAFKIYGQDALKIEPLEECMQSQSGEREIYWMKYYDATNIEKGYNIKLQSNGSVAFKLTDEQRQKISQSRKGAVFSEEHRERLRKANLGKKQTEETKQKQREWYDKMGGWTEEQKKMMGQSASYARSDETKKRMSSGTEKKIAEMKGMTLEQWRKLKDDAVDYLIDNNGFLGEVAEKFNISKDTLRDWKKKRQNES
jgi:group I intron endonuclease